MYSLFAQYWSNGSDVALKRDIEAFPFSSNFLPWKSFQGFYGTDHLSVLEMLKIFQNLAIVLGLVFCEYEKKKPKYIESSCEVHYKNIWIFSELLVNFVNIFRP